MRWPSRIRRAIQSRARLGAPDLVEHLQHRPRRAAVQRPGEGAERRHDGRARVGAGRRDHARHERGGVHAVVRRQRQVAVERADGGGIGRLPREPMQVPLGVRFALRRRAHRGRAALAAALDDDVGGCGGQRTGPRREVRRSAARARARTHAGPRAPTGPSGRPRPATRLRARPRHSAAARTAATSSPSSVPSLAHPLAEAFQPRRRPAWSRSPAGTRRIRTARIPPARRRRDRGRSGVPARRRRG